MGLMPSLLLLFPSALGGLLWSGDAPPPAKEAGVAAPARDAAIELVRRRATELVMPPYTPARIDQWASQLTDEARQYLERAATPARSRTVQDPRRPGSLWPAASSLPASTGGTPVGTTAMKVRRRKVVVPGQSYANGYLLTGATPEVGGRGNIPVSLQVEMQFVGPSNSRLPLPKARLGGIANAMAGPEKVAIDLNQLCLVLPGGREVDQKCNAFVVDNRDGEYGAIGTYNWNLDKVLALALLAGGGQGAADALKAATQTQIVSGVSNAITVPAPGDIGRQVAAGGAANAFGILADHVKGVLKDVRPSVNATNGQRMSIFVVDTIEIDANEEEFDGLVNPGDGFLPSGAVPRWQPSTP